MARQGLLLVDPHDAADAIPNQGDRRDACRSDRVEAKDIVRWLSLDHGTRFADRRFKGPHADVGNHVAAQVEALALDDLIRRRHLQPQSACRTVEHCGIGSFGRDAFERISARLDLLEVIAL